MPQIDDPNAQGQALQSHKAGNFAYSGTRLANLGAAEYTLVTIANDVSGSVSGFKKDMENALVEAVEACKFSPRANNLMLRHLAFETHVSELHGFKLFMNINSADYANCLNIGNMTALNDATINSIEATNDYAKQLVDNDYSVNGVIFVITDGCNNSSFATEAMIQKAIKTAQTAEKLESLVVIVIGVNVTDPNVSQELNKWVAAIGLDPKLNYIELKDASKKTLAKLAQFVSKSISAQSQALGTGGASKALTSGSLTI
jgi:uncharacterized protein YegL